MGFTYQMMQFQEERLWAAAHAIQALLDTASSRPSTTRASARSSARACSTTRSCHFRLAELKTEVEALRALVYMAPEKYVAGADVTELGVDGQAQGRPAGREVPDACLQYWGGMGYTWDNPVARHYRDGRLGSIGGGADEVMLGIIAKYMHTLPSRQ